ncbi:autotransporter-associated N-terminal domain-containing protein, partial [Fusobacterium necrophorum]
NISFSIGLVLLYVMLGMNAFAQEVNATVATKQEIGLSTDRLSEMLRRIKEENNKKLKGTQLELVQLMEQGDQVVKSPWASWQFGMNYFYNNGTKYKGRGDRSEKYSYEGIFTRSTDVFERNTSLDSVNYSKLTTSSDFRSGTTSLRKGILSQYGLVSERKVKEPIASFDVIASINPRNIEKTIKEPKIPSSVTFDLPKISVTLPTAPNITSNIPVVNVGTVQGKTVVPPVLPKTIAFNLPKIEISELTPPNIESNIPDVTTPEVQSKTVNPPNLPEAISFDPAEPEIAIPATPSLPEPPTFKIVVAADYNNGVGSGESGAGILKKQTGTDKYYIEETNNPSQNVIGKKDYAYLNYTWSNSYEKEGLAFKWFDGPNPGANYYFGYSYSPTLIYGKSGDTINQQITAIGKSETNYDGLARTVGITEISIDSYNNVTGLRSSTQNPNRNDQYFLVGGSRAIEFDSENGGKAVNVGTVNLNGILTLGMVSQGSIKDEQIINDGTITDKKEKDEDYIKALTTKYNTKINDSAENNALKIYGPGNESYDVSLDSNGYVGYKIGMALVPENPGTYYITTLDNKGEIKFYGGHSIGAYVYLPTSTGGPGTPVQAIFNGTLKNDKTGTIELSGKSSHGMKLAAKTKEQATYENAGTIKLTKNGNVAADDSTGMALMVDSTVKDVNLEKGKAKNTGTISLENVKNSSGMFVNINSNMTNQGTIAINSDIAKNNDPLKQQEYNIGMRADSAALTSNPATYTSPEIINDTGGKITLGGRYAIGMSVKGSTTEKAIATNKGEITGTNIKNGIGIFNLDGKITNSGTINLVGTGDSVNNIGIFLKKENIEANGTLETGSKITAEGNGSTGILLAEGTSLEYSGNLTVNGNKVSGIVVTNHSKVTENPLSGGAIKVGASSAAGGDSTKGSYGLVVKQGGELTLSKTETTVNVTGDKSVGIFSEGKMNLGKTNVITADGAVNFFAKDNGTISIKGGTSETGQKSLLFFQKTSSPDQNPKILIKDEMTAKIKGGTDPSNRGTAFFYQGNTTTGYSKFDSTEIETWKDKIFKDNSTNTLSKLTLNMENGSRLFVASRVAMDLTNTNPGELKNALGLKAITGDDYKSFMLYDSQLTIDKEVNLDSANDDYKKLEISNSSIINNDKISGKGQSQVAIAQENNKNNRDAVTITNNEKIKLLGANSTGIYAKYGIIENNTSGKIITTGANSTGIYALKNTEVSNKGTISVGANSTGIFYSDVESGKIHTTTTGLKNEGTIILTGTDAVGMYYEPGNIGGTTVTFENAAGGKIIAESNSAVGMYAKISKDEKLYQTINAGEITLKDGTTVNPTIGMYTDATKAGTNPLENKGTIKVGNNGIGMFGYELTTTGNITVGNNGIAMYSKNGNVTIGDNSIISRPTIKVGENKAVAVYIEGTSQNITSSNVTYEIGDQSYGFVNKGTGNDFNISGGSATLSNKGIFIYSSDKNGIINNTTDITSTGGNNYGIYSAGKGANAGKIDFTKGIGNIGIYATDSKADIKNSGEIKLGNSTKTNRSIGITTKAGTVSNFGKITVDGNYGLGLYSSGTGIINNDEDNANNIIGNITVTGDETAGAYANDTSDINLNAGTIAVNGNKAIGYYLNQGKNSKIASPAKINVTGDESTGVFVKAGKLTSYTGATTVTGDGVYGLVAGQNSEINATGGSLTVTGITGLSLSKQIGDRGAVGLVVQTGGTITGNGLNVEAKVEGEKSVGVYSAGTAQIGAANITASNGAVNFFAENGTISINRESEVETRTGANRGSLLFYASGDKSKILINGKMTAIVAGNPDASKTGTAFLYKGNGSDYAPFTKTDIQNWAKNTFGDGTTSKLNNLTLKMEDNSRLFVASNVQMNLSDTSGEALSKALGAKIEGEGYKTFMLYDSKLTVDNNVNLDNKNDAYNKLEISSSSIQNNFKIEGKQTGKVAIAQENTNTINKNRVTLTNNGTIELTGDKSTGIYAKFGVINNNSEKSISVGEYSTGIYALNNTRVSNKGTISVGKNSTGIFYSDVESKTITHNTTTGLKNEGTITLTGKDAVGMYYEPGNIGGKAVTFENAASGKIIAKSDSTEGMYAKVSKDNKSYDTINAGTIELTDGTSADPTIGMYTDAISTGTNPLENKGRITVGKHGIGMYGYEETTSGNITVGDKGVALYTQGGKVEVTKTSTLTVGKSDAAGIYAKGNGATIISAGNYKIGDDSYGIINKGAGNTVNITEGTAELSNRGKFIYSEDTKGKISTAAKVTATGDDNYGIYSSGNVTNTGTIDLSTGTGNIGILTKSATGNVENSGTIKVGDSTAADRSIGIVANDGGKAKNTGKIEVTKADGLGLYAVKGGTIENATGGTITTNGDSTIGAYAADSSNINLTGGEIKATGKSIIGYYLDKGTSSTVASSAKINVTGEESTGVFVSAGKLAYNGTTTVTGNGVYGLVAGKKSTINATGGNLTVTGTGGSLSNQTANRGTVGLVVQTGGEIKGNGLNVEAKVKGEKSVGVYSAGTAEIGKADITTSEGAVNFFAKDGTISINGESTVETGIGTGTNRGSLLFYAPSATSKILINAPMTATVKGDTDASRTGTAFFYQGQGTGYSSFTAADIGNWAKTNFGNETKSTLSNLTLNMEDNSRLFTASKVQMNLSDTSGVGLKDALGLADLIGSNYKTFMLYNSQLTINKEVKLDDDNDDYRKLEISNSSVINNDKISGTKANQVAIAQENNLADKNAVTIINKGSIELTGDNSTAIYAKNGTIVNNATGRITTTGEKSIGIFHSGEGKTATLKNEGNITVGDAGVAIYSKGGNVDLAGGEITTGAKEAVGVFTVGTKQEISNTGTRFNLKDNSFGFVNTGTGNTITTANTTTANLGKDSVYIYSEDTKGKVENRTNLTSTGDKNYGIYSAGTVINKGNINFAAGTGNVGIYTIKVGNAINRGTISVGASDVEKESYGIGMAIGGDKDSNGGSITNAGTILVQDANSIGMYGSGNGVKVQNDKDIILNANNTTGIYLDNGAEGINRGTIETGKAGLSKVVGVYLGENATLDNQGSIKIDATDGVGVYLKGGTVKNYGTITVTGTNSKDKYEYKPADTSKGLNNVKIDTKLETPVITRDGVEVKPFIAKKIEIDPKIPEVPSIDGKAIEGIDIKDFPKYERNQLVSKDSIGMYIDTSGINKTKPIEGLEKLTDKADLIVGTEASKYTTNKDIIIKDPNIINPYREAMLKNKKVTNWNIYSGSLTWMATAALDNSGYLGSSITMSKIPYTAFAGKASTPVNPTDSYNFLDGLEQRYGIEKLGTQENDVFQKLNGIGKNEETLLHQAFDEMMGHQYANVQQRIQATGSILDQEFKYLKKEWDTKSKDSNKIKAFGMQGEYKTDTAGIIDYSSHAKGVAYLHEKETAQLGNTTGWYAGLIHHEFKFKDIGKSKEEMLQAKWGVFKSTAFDHNNSLNWTISGEMFVGRNRMHRRYLVVDEIFHAKSRYWTYGLALTNEVSKTFRTSESTFV